jgi:hypothetical protein
MSAIVNFLILLVSVAVIAVTIINSIQIFSPVKLFDQQNGTLTVYQESVEGESVRGIQGIQGIQGIRGEQGIVGESIQGIRGEQGIAGESIQGIQGIQGEKGDSWCDSTGVCKVPGDLLSTGTSEAFQIRSKNGGLCLSGTSSGVLRYIPCSSFTSQQWQLFKV